MTESIRLLSPRYRASTVGIVLVITLLAFENVAVATAMPTAVRALHGLHWYAAAFTGFLLGHVIGIADAGPRADRNGPGPMLRRGLVVFSVGLLGAATSSDMALFVASRLVQGLGAGSLIVAVYVLISRDFAPALRPKVFAAVSAAWVLPSLVGPAISGAVTSALGWRWVFFGVLPLVAVGAFLLRASLSATTAPARTPTASTGEATRGRGRASLGLAGGVALLQLGAQSHGPLAVVVALAGFAIGLPSLRWLMPPGTLRLRAGVPTAVATRALLSGAFFGAEAFVPLAMTTVHRASPTVSGLPLTAGALGWSAGSWLQSRTDGRWERRSRITSGLMVLAGSLVVLALAELPGAPVWGVAAAWLLAGLGIGMAMATVNVTTMDLSPDDQQGRAASALQIADITAGAVCVALAGAIVGAAAATSHPRTSAFSAVGLVMAAIAVLGAFAARRGLPSDADGARRDVPASRDVEASLD